MMIANSITGYGAITTEALDGIAAIQRVIATEATDLYRSMPWRNVNNPYAIMVSEVMLQQTQVSRALDRYPRFLRRFPTVEALADASTASVVQEWQGLGYNRRALFLQRAAKQIAERHDGQVPQGIDDLMGLPGIGRATAGAIRVYAYDLPALFIETNIRRVFIFYCFSDCAKVEDSDIEPLLARSLPQNDYRRWYYALTDLGATLRTRVGHNPNRKSRQYQRQSPFEGSLRQLRGAVIRQLATNGRTAMRALTEVAEQYSCKAKVADVVATLIDEGFVAQERDVYYLKDSN